MAEARGRDESQRADLEAAVAGLRREADALRAENARLEARVSALILERTEADERCIRLLKDRAEARARIGDLEAALEEACRADEVADSVASEHERGASSRRGRPLVDNVPVDIEALYRSIPKAPKAPTFGKNGPPIATERREGRYSMRGTEEELVTTSGPRRR